MFSICCITISFWKVLGWLLRSLWSPPASSREWDGGQSLRGWSVSLRSMLLNVTWILPWNVSKHLGFRKLLLALASSYILLWKLLFTIVVSWKWHMKENQRARFHASRVETAYILPSLQKSGVNMACLTVFGNQKFASFPRWERGIKLKFSGLTVEKVRLFHLWSNLYFEMSDTFLILWIETYSVTLVH